VHSFLAVSGREEGAYPTLARWPDAGLVYFHLLLRGLDQQTTRSRIRGFGTEPT
jgi:hypothetical protein